MKTWKQNFETENEKPESIFFKQKIKTWEPISTTENEKTENKISEKPESKREERERERRKTGRAEARSGPTETFVKKSFLSHFRYAHFFLVSWYLLGSGLARGRQWQRQWEGPKKMPAARKIFEKDSAGTKFRNCQSEVKLRTLSVLRNWKIWASSFNLVSTVTTDQWPVQLDKELF